MDLLPEEKRSLPYHFFGDNYFSSMKLINELTASNYHYTGTIRKDRVKGNPPLTMVEKFKKKERGFHETVVLEDESQIIVRSRDLLEGTAGQLQRGRHCYIILLIENAI